VESFNGRRWAMCRTANRPMR